MSIITVDDTRCISCAICTRVCPMGVLTMKLRLGSGCSAVEEAVPCATRPEVCIRCGHCVASCPKGALDHAAAPLSGQIVSDRDKLPDFETAFLFLRSRRSIRVYKNETVPRETLLLLIDIARFAPTGTNTQGLSYLVVSDKEKLAQVTKSTVEWLEWELDRPGSKLPENYRTPVEDYRNGKDTILRNAPHLILVLTPPEILPVSADSAKLALEYVELLAPTIGLGTCWLGLVQLCARAKYPPLWEALQIPENVLVVGAISAGYPEYRHYRLVDRDPLKVYWL